MQLDHLSPTRLAALVLALALATPAARALELASADSDATGAAAAFLTTESQMQNLRNTFGVNRFPYFEVLLKTSRLSGTFFDAELVAYRSYPNLH